MSTHHEIDSLRNFGHIPCVKGFMSEKILPLIPVAATSLRASPDLPSALLKSFEVQKTYEMGSCVIFGLF